MDSDSWIFRQLFDCESWTYTYLLGDLVTGEALLIDSVYERAERDIQLLKELGLNLKYSFETHTHADHVTGASKLKAAFDSKIVTADAQVTGADICIQDGEKLKVGDIEIEAIATPGHTNCCVTYKCKDMIFTGDSLFIRKNGRTDFQGGSAETLYDSITLRLYALPDETRIFPGHDYSGQTVSSIGEEKKFNLQISNGVTKSEFVKTMSQLNLEEPQRIKDAVPANLKCGNV